MAVQKEVFVCDNCAARKRLPSAQRHWCDECNATPPVEMRPARDKRPSQVKPAPQQQADARLHR